MEQLGVDRPMLLDKRYGLYIAVDCPVMAVDFK